MSRFVVLPLVLLVLLGLVFVLPSRGKVAESAVRMELPQRLGDWQGVKRVETQLERDVLAKDTKFSKADYFRLVPGAALPDGSPDFERVSAMIVLSGYDINNSIHRPERCMPAQGHEILSGSDATVPLAAGGSLKVRRLSSRIPIRLSEGGQEIVMQALTYYFFVGHDSLTQGHYQRTFRDMRDRLIYGRDQRWAYVTVSTLFGTLPWSGRQLSEQEADQLLAGFAADFAGGIIDWEQIAK